MKQLLLRICPSYEAEFRAVLGGDYPDVILQICSTRCAKRPGPQSVEPVLHRTDHRHLFCLSTTRGPGASHVDLEQCMHMLAPKALIDHLQTSGAYVVTPGWVSSFREHVAEWGFDDATLREFMRESAARVVLLDTGIDPDAARHTREFAARVGLPWERLPVGLDGLSTFIAQLVGAFRLECERERAKESRAASQRRVADFALAFDLLRLLTGAQSEPEAIARVREIFTALFAPHELHYVARTDGPPPASSVPPEVRQRLGAFFDDYAWIDEGRGFILRIGPREEPVGVILATGFAVPESAPHYLDVALSISDVCGLAVKAARQLDALGATSKLLVHQARLAAMGEMLAAIAHQWRQPLNALGNILQDLRDARAYGELDDAYFDRGVQGALDQLSFMSRTIEDFRGFAAPRRGKARFSLRAAFARVLALLGPRLRRTEVDCVLLPGPDVELVGYENELQQVCLNLVQNSLDALEERRARDPDAPRGRVEIELLREDATVHLVVRDDGPGLPDAILQRMFEPYFSTKPPGRGTGLGLYMSRMILERHMGGSIAARDTGQGAELHVRVTDGA